MRIIIVGAGAIGSYLGASLAEAGHRVGLLGRPAYVERVRERGLLLTRSGVERTVTGVVAGEDLDALLRELQGMELAIVTAKAFDTAEACRLLLPYLADGLGRVVLVQNGVGGDDIAAGLLPRDVLVTGVITQLVSAQDVARYEVRGRRGGICLAPYQMGSPSVEPLVAMLQCAGLRCRSSPDGRAIRWSKLLLNMMANAVPTIEDLSPAEVYADDLLYSLEIAAYREALVVMRASGLRPVALPGYPVPAIAWLIERGPRRLVRALLQRIVGGARGGKKPSLQIDLERGRRESEVTFLNGAVAREAARQGLSAPANAAIAGVLEGLAAGTLDRGDLRRAPRALTERARALGWQG